MNGAGAHRLAVEGREIALAHVAPGWGRAPAVVAIPACDEAARTGACLAALARQPEAPDVLVFANNTRDATVARAREAAARTGLSAIVAEGTVPRHAGIGLVRRIACRAALRLSPGARHLMTTDADCEVAADWVAAANIRALARADAVCGRLLPAPGALAHLPAPLRDRIRHEARHAGLIAAARGAAHGGGGAPEAPAAHHDQTPGASIAVRRAAYEAVGGFPAVISDEDRALVRRLARAGRPVAYAGDVRVYPSYRLDGRAAGGMAETLRRGATPPDTAGPAPGAPLSAPGDTAPIPEIPPPTPAMRPLSAGSPPGIQPPTPATRPLPSTRRPPAPAT